MREKWSRGSTVTCKPNGRSYTVEAEAGGVFVRNRVHIKQDKTKADKPESDSDDDDHFDYVVYNKPRRNNNNNNPRNDVQMDYTMTRKETGYGFVPPVATRSARVIKPVK